jgi:hypothetical protein
MAEEKTVARIPFHWAVSILVVILMPTAFFFGKFNFTLWVVFIAWAHYFLYGGTPEAFKTTFPCYAYGAVLSVLWMLSTVAVTPFMPEPYPVMWAIMLTNLIWVTILVWGLKFYNLGAGVICVFGGMTMHLAIYFTASMPKVGPMDNPYWVVIWAGIWDIIMGYFGHFCGWLNVQLTFPKKVSS